MPHQQIIFNGSLVLADSPIFTAAHEALKYGIGAFETMRYDNGDIAFVQWHIERLNRALLALGIGHCIFDAHKVLKEVDTLVEANKAFGAHRIRLAVYVKSFGYDYVLENFAINGYPKEIELGVFSGANKGLSSLSSFKLNNYLPYYLAGQFAARENYGDVLVLNSEGNICETSVANVFIVKNNVVYTPPLSEGCIDGVFRKFLMESLSAVNNTVVEKPIALQELSVADEIFTTNSIRGITKVISFENKQYSTVFTDAMMAALSLNHPKVFI